MAMSAVPRPPEKPPKPVGFDSTTKLLALVRKGNTLAREQLAQRYLHTLRRWAHGRLPARARDLSDTDDLVQLTLIHALNRVDTFEPRREGAFLAYLRRALLNQIRDQIRRVDRRPGRESVSETLAAHDPSPLEEAIGWETLERYEGALAQLTEEQQEAIICRVELGLKYQEIAEALAIPSENAARMAVARALVRLAEKMEAAKGRERS